MGPSKDNFGADETVSDGCYRAQCHAECPNLALEIVKKERNVANSFSLLFFFRIFAEIFDVKE
jgi:hypothetical protein